MGFFDRVTRFGSGLWSGATDAFALVDDMMTAPWNDEDDFNSFWHVMDARQQQQLAEAGMAAFGPETGVGALIGGLPGPVRQVSGQVLEGLQTVYREGVAEPLSSYALQQNQRLQGRGATDPWLALGETTGLVGMGLVGQFRGGAEARTARALAESVSPGQAVALTLANVDVLDPDRVAETVGSDWFQVASGTVDALANFFLDPTLAVGAAAKVGRTRLLVRPIRHSSQLDEFFAATPTADRRLLRANWREVDGWIARQADESEDVHELAGRIRERLFKASEHGDIQSMMLAVAPDRRSREAAMRFLMGDGSQLQILEDYAADLGQRTVALAQRRDEIARIRQSEPSPPAPGSFGQPVANRLADHARRVAVLHDQALRLAEDTSLINTHTDPWMREMARFTIRNSDERHTGLRAVEEMLGVEATMLERLRVAHSSVSWEPRLTIPGDIREAATRSHWYLDSALGRTVQVATAMKPRRRVDLEDQTSISTNLARMLHQGGADPAEAYRWRGRLMAASNPGERLQVWTAAEDAMFRRIAAEYNIAEESVAEVLRLAEQGRGAARQHLNNPHSRSYAAGDVDWIRTEDADGHIVLQPMPLSRSQTPNWITSVDFRQVRHSLDRLVDSGIIDKAAVSTPVVLAKEALDTAAYAWRTAVLLRPGWTMRVISDEQLRKVAKFGAMATVSDLPRGTRNVAVRIVKEMGWDKTPAVRVGRFAARRSTVGGGLFGAATGFMLGGPVGAGIGAAGGAGLLRKLVGMEMLGYPQVAVRGYRVADAFGAPGDAANVYRGMLSQAKDMDSVLGQAERGLAARLRTDKNNWQTVKPDAPNHTEAWLHTVNNQVGGDRLWGQALDGIGKGEVPEATMGRMLDWLETPDGLAYLREVPWRTSEKVTVKKAGAWVGQSPEVWIETLYDEAHRVVGGNQALAAKAARKSVSADDLNAAMPDRGLRPEVNGQVMLQTLGRSEIQATVNGFVQRAFHVLGTIPTDELSRAPAFARFYSRRMEELIGRIDTQGGRLSEAQLHGYERQARQHALFQTRRLMYDLAERSEFGEMVRHIMPFFDAYREVVTRWANLGVENPVFLIRTAMIWQSLDTVTLPWFGTVTDEETGDKYFQFRIPEWARGLADASPLFRNALDSQGFMRVASESFKFSPALGSPSEQLASISLTFGVGPFVQLAAAQVLAARPDAEDALKWALPFGAPDDVVDNFLPAWGRRARSLLRKEDDRAYLSAYHGVLRTKLVEMNLDPRLRVDLNDPTVRERFLEEVKDETNALFRLRMVTNFTAPVAPNYLSPYQPWIEEYRRLRNEDPEHADERFYEMYGDEFFPLTQGLTRLNNGIPSTIQGFHAESEFGELIRALPEPSLGGLVAGRDGAGAAAEFSSAMYDRQLRTPLREGSRQMQREPFTTEEFIAEPDIRLGWEKFIRVLNLIDAEMVRRGLPNLRVREAEDLALIKRAATLVIGGQHPAWARDRETFDEGKWRRRMEGLRMIAADPRMNNRPDIVGLRDYLGLRERMIARLAEAESPSLSASANMELAAEWETTVALLRERNPAFADLHSRWLSQDPLAADTSVYGITPVGEAA